MALNDGRLALSAFHGIRALESRDADSSFPPAMHPRATQTGHGAVMPITLELLDLLLDFPEGVHAVGVQMGERPGTFVVVLAGGVLPEVEAGEPFQEVVAEYHREGNGEARLDLIRILPPSNAVLWTARSGAGAPITPEVEPTE